MKGKTDLKIEPGQHTLKIDADFPVLVSINQKPARALGGGSHRWTFKTTEGGTIQIDPTEAKREYGVDHTYYKMSRYDEVNDEAPPPPPAPDNYLQAIAAKVRQDMGIIRENFAERTSIYQMGDMDFEEEQYEAQKNNQSDPVSDSENASDPEPQEPQGDAPPEPNTE